MDRSERKGTCFRAIGYDPLPSQARFHHSTARFKGFSGPIGSGKSQALCQEAIKLAYINAGRQGLIGAPTYPMLRDATQVTLLEILDTNDIPYSYNKAESILTLRDTRSRILFRPVDEFERLRGTNLAWFGLDELTYAPEDSWLRLEGRLRDPRAKRLCGFAVWTPKGYDWVYRKFIAHPVDGYEVTLARAFENRHLMEKVPDFYERLRHSYDAKFYRQEVMGEYLSIESGLVYSAFNRQINVAELTMRPELRLFWALDFNVDPMCSVVAQVAGNTVVVLDEIVMSRASTQEACDEFTRRFGPQPRQLNVYGDVSGNKMQTTGDRDYDVIREHFRATDWREVEYKVPNSNPPVRDRVALVNAKLRSASGETELLVDRKCTELIKDFEEVCYKAQSNAIDKDKDARRTHLSDALGYLIWQECRKLPPVGERREPLML